MRTPSDCISERPIMYFSERAQPSMAKILLRATDEVWHHLRMKWCQELATILCREISRLDLSATHRTERRMST